MSQKRQSDLIYRYSSHLFQRKFIHWLLANQSQMSPPTSLDDMLIQRYDTVTQFDAMLSQWDYSPGFSPAVRTSYAQSLIKAIAAMSSISHMIWHLIHGSTTTAVGRVTCRSLYGIKKKKNMWDSNSVLRLSGTTHNNPRSWQPFRWRKTAVVGWGGMQQKWMGLGKPSCIIPASHYVNCIYDKDHKYIR